MSTPVELLAFFRDIEDNPFDDSPRQICADWLEEHGDVRGEFIRVQCLLAGLPEDDPRRPDLRRREREILHKHLRDWLGPLHRHYRDTWQFHRGFLDEVTLTVPSFLELAAVLFQVGPVRHVCFQRASAHLEPLASSPHLRRLSAITLSYNFINDAGATALARSPHLTRLRTLNLAHNFIRNGGAEALAAAVVPHLTCLDLSGNPIGPPGRQVLADRFGACVTL